MSEDDTLEAIRQSLTDGIDILVTVAVAVGVILALLLLLGIAARHRTTTGQRRAELAEATLAAFYEARDNLTWVRLGASSGDEGASRPGSYYSVLERINGQSEFWSRFLARRYRFRALFGDRAA